MEPRQLHPNFTTTFEANHCVGLAATSTDVFGVPLPRGSRQRRPQPQAAPSANLTASRHCVTENDTTTKTMFVINKSVLVGGQPAAAPPAALGGSPRRQPQAAARETDTACSPTQTCCDAHNGTEPRGHGHRKQFSQTPVCQ